MLSRNRQVRNSILLAVLLAGAFFALYQIGKSLRERSPAEDSDRKAVIRINGETVHTMDLDTDAQYRVETSDGNYNTVIVKDRSVRVGEADCENQVCVKTGAIHYPGEVIAGMPHRLIVSIEDGVR